jgi:AP-2 complex subunit alpha
VCFCACLEPQATILANLKDPDVSIRRRALDLLFTMCDGGAAVEVVEELVGVRCRHI